MASFDDKSETKAGTGEGARILGHNGGVDDKFWYRSGLSLMTESPVSPPGVLEEFDDCDIPASEISTGDIVVFFQGNELFWKDTSRKNIDTSRLNLLRLGVAYSDARDRLRVISQDEHGNVWDHPIDQLPGYNKDDWDYYGLHLRPENTDMIPTPRRPHPFDVIETWLPQKHV